MAKVLLADPEILLLDEPTKGMDAVFKQRFAEILRSLLQSGKTVVLVSHDVEFCAEYATRCALFFDGAIVAEAPPRAFFSDNRFYTTAAARMASGIADGAVTAADLVAVCGGEMPSAPTLTEEETPLAPVPEKDAARPPARWRRVTAALSLAAFLAVMLLATRYTDLSAAVAGGDLTPLWLYGCGILAALGFALSVSRRQPSPPPTAAPQKLPRRTRLACAVSLLLVPATVLVGNLVFDNRKYYFIALLVLLECAAPFFLVFEGRPPRARELTLPASLCALAVASRALFYMLPECKPVVAITVLAGVSLGAESGFLCGAVTMLVSNMLFGQGPWTPWQMFALGLCGFFAGLLFRGGRLLRSRALLCAYGAIASVVLYGGIMNLAAALLAQPNLTATMLRTYYGMGFPVDMVRAAAPAVFLWCIAEPMLAKLERVKEKYGLQP